MKVAFYTQHYGFTLGDALSKVCPLPRELDGSLDGFSTSVHGKDHVVSEHLSDLLGEAAKDAVIERPRRKSEFLCLLDESGNDTGMTVALIVEMSIVEWR